MVEVFERVVRGGRLLWRELRDVGSDGDRVVERVLVDVATGEVLDAAWRDEHGRTRSWSKGRVDPPAAGDALLSSATVDRSPEAGRRTRRIA